MKINFFRDVFFFFCITGIVGSCHHAFLDERPSKSLVVPTKIEDFQALLNNTGSLNWVPGLGTLAGDELFVPAIYLSQYQNIVRDAYLWNLTSYPANSSVDWNQSYESIFYANVVLDGVEKVGDDSGYWRELEGAARFYRAWANYALVQTFGDLYNPNELSNLRGIPIRMEADIEIVNSVNSLEETYAQINEDLRIALDQLPDVSPYNTRPSKVACYALYARIFLSIEDYSSAFENAQQALALYDHLLDYNTLDAKATRPFPVWSSEINKEIIFYSAISSASIASLATTFVDTILINEFCANDLRKECFFRERESNRFTYKGSYTGTGTLFGGLATDELYLVCAESVLRLGDPNQAKQYLNKLLYTRWKSNTYVPVEDLTEDELLELILMERRKQLFLRGTRWSDLKRLNNDDRFKKTLVKTGLDNGLKKLEPFDSRYVFPLPLNETSLIY